MNSADLIHDLIFLNYCHNRRRSPDITPERWEKVYGPQVWEFEIEFLAQQSTVEEERGDAPR